MIRQPNPLRGRALIALTITAAAGATALLVNGCSGAPQDPTDEAKENLGASSAALTNLGVPGEAIDDSIITPQGVSELRGGLLAYHNSSDRFTNSQGRLVTTGTNCTTFPASGDTYWAAASTSFVAECGACHASQAPVFISGGVAVRTVVDTNRVNIKGDITSGAMPKDHTASSTNKTNMLNYLNAAGSVAGTCNSRYEAEHYYYPKIMGVAIPYSGAMSALPLATLAQFKAWSGIPAQNVGESLDAYRARTNTLIYYNYTGLQLGREMACGHFTDTDGQQGTGCYVSNYGQQFGDEPSATADAALGIRRKNTVCISFRPSLPVNERVNFYVYDRNDNLSSYAALDDHGDRPVPQICTNCHSGTYTAADHYVTNARFLPPDPYVLHFASSGTYTQANQLPVVRYINNMIYTDSFGLGYGMLTTDQQAEVRTLYSLPSNATTIPSNAVAGDNAPPAWTDTTAHSDLYKKVLKPLCQTCHSAASVHYTDSWASMSTTSTANAIWGAVCLDVIAYPQSNYVAGMPQSAPAMKAFWADPVTVGGVNYLSGKNALFVAMGWPVGSCAGTIPQPPGAMNGAINLDGCTNVPMVWNGTTYVQTLDRAGADKSCGMPSSAEENPLFGNGKYCNWSITTDANGTNTSDQWGKTGMCMDGCDPTGAVDANVKCHAGEECVAYANQIGGRCVKCGGPGQPACTLPVTIAGPFTGSGSNGGSGTTCLASYTFGTVAGGVYTIADPGCTGDSYVKVSGSCVCANDDYNGLCSSCTCTAASTGTATICASTYNTASSAWTYGVKGPTAASACGSGALLGEIGEWSGKVDVHRANGGGWIVDSDCSSGAGHNTVAYCQKFWPGSTSITQIAVSSELKPYTSGGGAAPNCGGFANAIGHEQYACCGASP